MSIINSQPLIGASGQGGYFLSKSLRFRSSAGAYLSRTPASAGNQKTWTWSAWVKPARFASQQPLFNSYSSATNYGLISFSANAFYNANDTLKFNVVVSNANQLLFETSAVYRDPSAWYHIVIALDTTQATNTNRVKIYVNGVQVTAFITATYPTQNLDVGFFNTTNQHQIGSLATGTYGYFDGYMTEINFIDGQALTPSSFGSTNSQTGVWQPARYTGTYGTNGFYLPFTNTTSTSTLGNDFSGNGNNWTVNNISLTSGVTYDSMTDVPTLTNASTANYCVLNPLDSRSGNTVSNGNLQIATGSTAVFGCRSTLAVSSGKWYWEMTPTANVSGAGCDIGIDSVVTPITTNDIIGFTSTSYGYRESGQKVNNGSSTSYGSSYTTNDIIGIALDLDAGTLVFYKNNVSQGTAFTGISGTFTPAISDTSGGQGVTVVANFGQQPFNYTPPTGFVALNTFNLSTPTIGATASTQANKYMNIVLYSGNDTNRTITGVGFQPDFVWIKGRNAARFHNLFDAVRGAGYDLRSNSTNAEVYDNDTLTAFASDGFSLGTDVTSGRAVNYTGDTYVAWNWKANGSGSTNTAGSITSTVSANTTAGFSIATFTTPAGYSTGTVGHGLGVTPSMIIVKNRTAPSGANNWNTFHTSIGNTGALYLNTTGATTTSSAFWNNTSPTSSVFTVGTNLYASTDYVAYCFAQVAGYSAFGSYTGNGSSDGTFVYTGFRPRFVMVKRTDTVGFWPMKDTARDPYNVAGSLLFANASDAEYSNNQLFDLNSNGFKLRGSNNDINASGGTYIYMAFAESPFKFSNAR